MDLRKRWQPRLYDIIFESNTRSGRLFDIFFLLSILASVVIVMLDSVLPLHQSYGNFYHKAEWAFTILFTIEYLSRVLLTRRPLHFIFSFLGIVDMVAILPSYLSLFIVGTQPFLILRALRLLRIFRIFRLSHFLTDLRFLSRALGSSMRKILIFFIFALVVVIVLGSMMYLVEDPKDGFWSIPQCIYWAITTITTVGYGDVHPVTPIGKVVANIVMLIGYAIIAVPTGIITTEMALAIKAHETGHEICKSCNKGGHDHDAKHCKHCGAKFDIIPEPPDPHGHHV